MTAHAPAFDGTGSCFEPGLKYDLFENHAEEFNHYLRMFARNPVFEDAQHDEVVITGNPYRRPLRVRDICVQDFTRRLSRADINSNSALSANRILLNIYESDFLFLPPAGAASCWRDFARFYDPTCKVLGEIIRPVLEEHLFGFLESEVRYSGAWTPAALKDYLHAWPETCRAAPDALGEAVLGARNREEAARFFLIQLAADYLTEASVMGRNVLGSYGPELSELFKVLIDEYGNGVHEAKHSTLYEDTLRSVGLSSTVHAYWQFYLPASLLTNNYFHSLSKDHRRFFRYLGGLYNTEVSLISATRAQSNMLKAVFGEGGVDTRYFDEHAHIDRFHGQMVLERLILPALERFGDAIVPEILLGFEHVRLLQEIADRAIAAQIRFFDSVQANRPAAARLYHRVQNGELKLDLETFVEPLGERSTTHIHDDHRLLAIEEGEMDFWPRQGDPLRLVPGDVLFIPRHRLHGSVVTSARCVYHQPIVPPGLAREYFSEMGGGP